MKKLMIMCLSLMTGTMLWAQDFSFKADDINIAYKKYT